MQQEAIRYFPTISWNVKTGILKRFTWGRVGLERNWGQGDPLQKYMYN